MVGFGIIIEHGFELPPKSELGLSQQVSWRSTTASDREHAINMDDRHGAIPVIITARFRAKKAMGRICWNVSLFVRDKRSGTIGRENRKVPENLWA
jgi:hypothetical protein